MKDNTSLKVTSREITSATDPVLDEIRETYVNAFPPGERRDFTLTRSFIEDNPYYHLQVVYLSGQYAGFISFWQFEKFIFAEHFAINPVLRNQGIGAQIMKELQRLGDRSIVLEVEEPEDELTRRRVDFYIRLGFTLDTHYYEQPPYRKGDLYIPMKLMAYGELDLATSFSEVKKTLYREIYHLEG